MNEPTLTMEVPAHVERSAAAAGIKTILFHLIDDARWRPRLSGAIDLARTCGAHLSCVHITPANAYVAFDALGGVFVMSQVMKAIDERRDELTTLVEAVLDGEDISWDYADVTGDEAAALMRAGAVADLVVADRLWIDPAKSPPAIALLGDLVQASRAPLLIPSNEGRLPDPGGIAAVAWDGSIEAANAVRAGLPLLAMAKDVHLIQVREQPDGNAKGFPGTRILEYLSRHGIHAELTVEGEASRALPAADVADRLVDQCRRFKADYLVMGAYSHSRMGELMFGGVTRTLLAHCPLPLLVAH